MPTNKAPGTRCTILITAPYQEQTQLIRLIVGQPTPLFAVKELVEVRTVTAAQGHNADISIHGVTRDDGRRLSNDKRLSVVAQSRAKWLACYILPAREAWHRD